jgi:hypothetical protein
VKHRTKDARSDNHYFFGFDVKVPPGPVSFTGSLPAFSIASHSCSGDNPKFFFGVTTTTFDLTSVLTESTPSTSDSFAAIYLAQLSQSSVFKVIVVEPFVFAANASDGWIAIAVVAKTNKRHRETRCIFRILSLGGKKHKFSFRIMQNAAI